MWRRPRRRGRAPRALQEWFLKGPKAPNLRRSARKRGATAAPLRTPRWLELYASLAGSARLAGRGWRLLRVAQQPSLDDGRGAAARARAVAEAALAAASKTLVAVFPELPLDDAAASAFA